MRSLSRRRGFTLIELLVAIGLTGVVAVGLYSMSVVSSQSFQQQQRASEMQLRLRLAMESLRADIARAGYMATPNSSSDPRVCPRPTSPMQAVELTRPTNPTHLATANRFITPVQLRLLGNYQSTDEYRVMGISGSTVQLQHRTAAYNRIVDAASFERLFLNRTVRIMGTNGVMQFGTVTAVSYRAPTDSVYPTVTLSAAPLIIGGTAAGSMAAAGCGIPGLGVGATIAPITIVEYRIANLASTQRNAYTGNAQMTTGKTDLVRTEYTLGAMGVTAIEGSERIVGEYAVDFDVAAVVRSVTNAANGDPAYTSLAFGDNVVFSTLASGGPAERVRALRVRLSVRDRVQDPDFGWVQRTSGNVPLTAFQVFSGQRGAARVRTLITEIALTNVSTRNL